MLDGIGNLYAVHLIHCTALSTLHLFTVFPVMGRYSNSKKSSNC
jgi:hypothetical protein